MRHAPTFLQIAFLIAIIVAFVLGRGHYVGSEAVPRPSHDGILWFMECHYLYPDRILHVPVGMGATVEEAYATHKCKTFHD